jgi:DNA-binding PadR family transcriptional regulator
MKPPATIGQFEQLVMAAILARGHNAYSVTVHATVETLSGGRSVSLGAVYTTLDRLEDKGLITSWLADPTPERGGRAKRHYRLEPDGERALRESVLTARRISMAVEAAWGRGIWSAR